jgi:hypothetical protein
MKIKMVAIAPYDGWAFITQDEKLYMLKPPFRSRDLTGASARDLEKAVNHHGFQAFDREFPNFQQLILYLKQEYVNNMKEMGFQDPSREELAALLQYAGDEILDEYLGRIEKEFIPGRKLAAAESLLLDLLHLDRFYRDNTRRDNALRLLKECLKQKEELAVLSKRANGHDFPSLRDKYREGDVSIVKETIFKQGQFLSFGQAA